MNKITKAVIIFFSILTLHIRAFTQENYTLAHSHEDLLNSLISTKQREGIDTLFCFFSVIERRCFTFFFWIEKNEVVILTITDSGVSKAQKIHSFLNEYHIDELFIAETESHLQFIPPLGHDPSCDFFVRITKEEQFFLITTCDSFAKDKTKEKRRTQFLEKIRYELSPANNAEKTTK